VLAILAGAFFSDSLGAGRGKAVGSKVELDRFGGERGEAVKINPELRQV
jgi:hypothetical protein